jgi:hypothetical protein
MHVSEALQLGYEQYCRPIEISGHLVISSHFTCLYEDETATRFDNWQRGILVNRAALNPLEEQLFPCLVGTSVSLKGDITLKATITHTGIALTPAYLPYIYEFSFSMPGYSELPVFSYKHGDPFVDVFLQVPASVTAAVLTILKPLFPANLTVMQLRQILSGKSEHQVGQHVRGEEFQKLTAAIEEAGCKWHAKECLISRGMP